MIVVGKSSIGAYYFYARVLSGCIACQIHKYYPYKKIVGPIMHVPFYIVVPYSIYWLLTREADDIATPPSNIHYRFVVYTTIITSISLVLDTMTFIKWMLGYKIGVYPLRKQFQHQQQFVNEIKTNGIKAS